MLFTAAKPAPVSALPDAEPAPPSLTATYVLSLVTQVVGLLLVLNLIDDGTAKLVTGFAVVLVPLGFSIAQTIAAARVHAARLVLHAALRAAVIGANRPRV